MKYFSVYNCFSLDIFRRTILLDLSQIHQTLGNILQFEIVYKELSTVSCRVSYVPRLAKVVNVLAVRQVKQGTETTRLRIGFTLQSCQYDSS